MSEDVSSFEVHPRQGAFRMAGGSLLAIALLPPCSSDEACTNTHQLQHSTCADARSWAHVDSHAQSGAVGDKGATILNETREGCEATYLRASLWSWAYQRPNQKLVGDNYLLCMDLPSLLMSSQTVIAVNHEVKSLVHRLQCPSVITTLASQYFRNKSSHLFRPRHITFW